MNDVFNQLVKIMITIYGNLILSQSVNEIGA